MQDCMQHEKKLWIKVLKPKLILKRKWLIRESTQLSKKWHSIDINFSFYKNSFLQWTFWNVLIFLFLVWRVYVRIDFTNYHHSIIYVKNKYPKILWPFFETFIIISIFLKNNFKNKIKSLLIPENLFSFQNFSTKFNYFFIFI